jgi:DNA repair ATPase RecN
MRVLFFVILIACTPLLAVADPLDLALNELDSVVADLEATQSQTQQLHDKLQSLESLTAEHRQTLADQQRLLDQYKSTVGELEAHDAATLALLAQERSANSWLLPAAGIASALAVVEAVLLVVLR